MLTELPDWSSLERIIVAWDGLENMVVFIILEEYSAEMSSFLGIDYSLTLLFDVKDLSYESWISIIRETPNFEGVAKLFMVFRKT